MRIKDHENKAKAAKPPARAESSPSREPEKLLHYAAHLEEYMAQSDWTWTPYQAIIYFAARHKQALGDYGDHNIKRDTGIFVDAMKTLAVDGIAVQTAIDSFLECDARDKWVAERGAGVPQFKTRLAQIKARLNGRHHPSAKPHTAARPISQRFCARRRTCPDFETDEDGQPRSLDGTWCDGRGQFLNAEGAEVDHCESFTHQEAAKP